MAEVNTCAKVSGLNTSKIRSGFWKTVTQQLHNDSDMEENPVGPSLKHKLKDF